MKGWNWRISSTEENQAQLVVLAGLLLPRDRLLVARERLGPVALLLVHPSHLVVGGAQLVVLAGLLKPRNGLLIARERL